MPETHRLPLPDGSTELEISVARPATVSGDLSPAVLIFPTWAGRNAFVENKARALAELGFIGIAADVYGDGKVGADPAECAALMNPLVEDRAELRRRLLALADGVGRVVPGVDPDALAAIGFCFGGLCALDLARSGAPVRGVVSFHGLFHPPPPELTVESIPAKVLALHGYDDPMVPVEQVTGLADELTAAGCDWQIHAYGGTMHAFTNPAANDASAGTVYLETADRRSWQTMREFFGELFPDFEP